MVPNRILEDDSERSDLRLCLKNQPAVLEQYKSDFCAKVGQYEIKPIKKLLLNHEFVNVNGGSVIDEISKRRPDNIKRLLADLVTQVSIIYFRSTFYYENYLQQGKGLLVVNQENCTVNFNVMRYHSSYFDETLRDFYGYWQFGFRIQL